MGRRAPLPLCPMPAGPTYSCCPRSTYSALPHSPNASSPGNTRSEVTGASQRWNGLSGALRNGTVTLAVEVPILTLVEADEERSVERGRAIPAERSPADLESLGIGLLSSRHRSRASGREPCFDAATASPMRTQRRRWSRSAATASCCRRCTDMLESGLRQAGVRDEPRHGRLPDERLADRPAGRAHRRRQGDPRCAARDAGDDRRRRDIHPRRDQRSVAAEGNAPDGEDRDFGQWPRRPARARLRRRAGRDAGRLDRVQSVRARADPAACRRKCWR